MYKICASKFLAAGVFSAGLIAMALPAQAQYDYGRPDTRYDSRYDSARRQGDLFDRVQRHLDRAYASPNLSGGAQRRIDSARREVWQFQARWNQGRFDKGQLDDAIASVRRVVDSDSIDYRDRRVLQDDLARMRGFRASRGYDSWGSRGYEYGYR